MDEPDEPATEPDEAGGEPDPEPDGSSSFERPVDKFRRTAAGTAIAAGMFGLRDALEGRPEREETVMEVSAPTAQPAGDLDVVVDLDHPENPRVVIRRPVAPDDPTEVPD